MDALRPTSRCGHNKTPEGLRCLHRENGHDGFIRHALGRIAAAMQPTVWHCGEGAG